MERLTKSEHDQFPSSMTPDGETLAFVDRYESNYDICFLNVRDGQVTPFLNSQFYEAEPEFSPDSKWIAYVTDESGREEVYIQTDSGFSASKPRFLMEMEGYHFGLVRSWDISPGGRRFLAVKKDQSKLQPITELILVQN